jgi:hypothetical protein
MTKMKTRYFILSDIHSNLEALQAVLADISNKYPDATFASNSSPGKDKLICLGDVIGYMTNPNEVMGIVWPMADVLLIGNHERSVGKILRHELDALDEMNPYAAQAVMWNASHLSESNKQRILELSKNKERYSVLEGNVIFAHSTPFESEEMNYIMSRNDANCCFFGSPISAGKIAFVGHCHIPQIYVTGNGSLPGLGKVTGGQVTFGKNGFVVTDDSPRNQLEKRLVHSNNEHAERKVKSWNLGKYDSVLASIPSVGQPRDRINYAGYAVYYPETKKLEMVRIPYDIAATQKKMQEAGLPERLWERLQFGR